MKKLIKKFLKHLPPLKQFLAIMSNLENRINTHMEKLRNEIEKLQLIVGDQNKQIKDLRTRINLLEEENKRISILEMKLCVLDSKSSRLEEHEDRILQLEQNCKEYINVKGRINLLENHIKRLDGRIDTDNYTMNYLFYKGLHPDCYEAALNDWYYQRTGKHMDVANPKTYNEKIQWIKLFDNSPLKTKLADKYMVRDWVSEKIGEKYLIPILGVWNSFDEIDFDKLPNKFVLKANHGSGWNVIVKDKTTLDLRQVKNKFDYWMKRNFAFYGLELQYMNIPRKIIAEEYLEELDQIYDYKFMCFDGRVKFIWVDTDRFTNHKRTLFTTKWEKMDEQIIYPSAKYDIPKPVNFEKMLELAEVLSQGFIHVRVDLYDVNGKIYFGEMTFTPESGALITEPEEFEIRMGRLIEIKEKKPYPNYRAIN